MMRLNHCFFIYLTFLFFIQTITSIPSTIQIASVVPSTRSGDPTPGYPTALNFAVDLINSDTRILPNTTIVVTNSVTSDAAKTFKFALEAYQNGTEIFFCCMQSSAVQMAGPVSTIGKMPMMAFTAASDLFSNKYNYPFFNRVNPRSNDEASAAITVINYLYAQSGIIQYKYLSIICTTDEYGVSGSTSIVNNSGANNITIISYQQFLPGSTDLSIEFSELRAAEGRVFVAVMDNQNFRTVSYQGSDLFGEYYIWICLAACASSITYYNQTSQSIISDELYQNEIGMIGSSRGGFTNDKYNNFSLIWQSLDPVKYPGAGVIPDAHTCYIIDGIYFFAIAIDRYLKMDGFTDDGKLKNVTEFLEILRNSTMNGLTGYVQLLPNGDRVPFMNIVNLKRGNLDFNAVGYWNKSGLSMFNDIYFYNGDSTIPDIDIRAPFKYWDCSDQIMKTDETGKTIKVQPPDASNPRYIRSTYYCDSFIDCENFSDETKSCSTNYLALFIIFGVFTGIMIIVAILLIIFTIIFGFIIPKQRIRAASPVFLITLIISCIVGLSSIYAWFGKPNHVACGFQPWLLGLSVTSMVACLCARTFRIWRIFKSPFDRKVISDIELLLLWVVMMIPALVLLFLWTLISTPTTRMKELQGEKHLMCDTGGFTGPPGGYIFFGIYVGYTSILACFAAFLSVVTLKVPSIFNESKLLSIAIYNLVFLSIIAIPVVVVLNTINPFVAWIIRSIAIWYAFSATLFLQFTPKMIGLLRDKVNPPSMQTGSGATTLFKDTTDIDVFRALPEAATLDDDE